MMRVAAGLLRRPNGQVLLTRRPLHKAHGGLWEFPGGKLEGEENWQQGLRRELLEELGIECDPGPVRQRVCLGRMELALLEVDRWTGQPLGLEGQPLRWHDCDLLLHRLRHGQLPPADALLAEGLCRPLLAITPADFLQNPPLLERLPLLARQGVRRLLLRLGPEVDAGAAEALRGWLADCTGLGLEPILHARLLPLMPDWSGMVHLPESMLRTGGTALSGRPFSYACHDATSLRLAERAGAAFALLSPVMPTTTHPDAPPLGWPGLAERLRGVQLPVYALGGVGPKDLAQARLHGAVGVAGIRAFWA